MSLTATKTASLLAKHLTEDIRAELAGRKTSNGFTIDDAIRSGVENPDSSVGVYAGDAESYSVFAPFFDRIIHDYHGHAKDGVHSRDMDASKLEADDLDPTGEYVVSTRIRVGRNVHGYAFAPAISDEHRAEVERRITEALGTLDGELKGQYFPLEGMDEETRVRLVQDHFLFKKGDRFLESAGANRSWPTSRGIFHSADKRFLVWVNEEDQLRIISMQQGGGVREVFSRLADAIKTLEQKLTFSFDEHLGYHSSCPTNLGTAMRASVHVRIPNASTRPDFKAVCDEMKLSVRGIDGEHSESKGGIYDISNKQRLGLSEVDAVNVLIRGVKKLIAMEQESAVA